MKNNLWFFVLFSGIFFGLAKSADAATYYVTNSGNDNCNGTSQAIGTTGDCAWKTLSKVNGRTFSPGDNIYFKRGNTWNERLLIPSSGSSGSPITFGAYGTGNKPMFDGTGIDLLANHGIIRGESRSFIIIENIRVQDVGVEFKDNNTGIGFYGGSNIIVQNCEVNNIESAGIKMNTSSNVNVLYNDVTMTNCDDASEQISFSAVNGFEIAYNKSYTNCNPSFSPPGGAGIDTKDSSRNGTVHHNEVYNIAGGSNGIYPAEWAGESFNIDVYSNYIHDINGAAGINLGVEAGGTLHDILIHHNIVTKATRGGLNMHNTGTTGGPVYDIKIFNNTFYLNGTSGTDYLGGARIFDQLLQNYDGYNGITIKNNIFASAYNWQIGYDDNVQSSDIIMDHNVVFGAHTTAGGFTAITPPLATNQMTGDPKFINAANGDFTLQTTSSARNTCSNSVWQNTANVFDYAGTRITDASGNIVAPGGTVDCGAIEYTDSVDTTSPTAPTSLSVL